MQKTKFQLLKDKFTNKPGQNSPSVVIPKNNEGSSIKDLLQNKSGGKKRYLIRWISFHIKNKGDS